MSYDALRANDTVRVHGHTDEEIAKRLQEMEQVARRHLADAESIGLSPDAKHNLAYTGGRVAAEMVMVAEGFRAGRGMGKHVERFTSKLAALAEDPRPAAAQALAGEAGPTTERAGSSAEARANMVGDLACRRHYASGNRG